VFWLLALQIRRGRKVQTQVRAVNSNSRTTNVADFQRKTQSSGFSAYPEGSPSQLIRINGVILYFYSVYTFFFLPIFTVKASCVICNVFGMQL